MPTYLEMDLRGALLRSRLSSRKQARAFQIPANSLGGGLRENTSADGERLEPILGHEPN